MIRPIEEFKKTLASIADIANAKIVGDPTTFVTGLTMKSADVIAGDLFIALPGEKVHGASFAPEAVSNGAVAVLTDQVGAQSVTDIPVLIVTNPRRVAGVLSSWFYGEPMRDLYSVGVTGTNGKTTVTTLLHQILSSARVESGLIGTVETRIGSEILESKRTTPESCEIQALSAILRERHIRNLVMEVSSHAITLERIRGSHFSLAAFTNLSQDHLDFHKDMDDYFATKAKLFTFEFADLAVINIDDSYGRKLAEVTELPIISISRFNSNASWYFTQIDSDYFGSNIAIRGSGGILIEGRVNLHGGYNFDNLLMAIAIASESGIDQIDIAATLSSLTGAHGRFESVQLGQKFVALVDYAHSPDSVERVLEAAREITNGRVIAVLGCGGDRDVTKRSAMGKALINGAHIAIFTSDNPRSEEPESILEQMTFGLIVQSPNQVIPDRSVAIKCAVDMANQGDLVIILGKGHEKGQEINETIFPFDDSIELALAIENKK